MKKEISPAIMFGTIAVVLVVAGFFIFKAISGDKSNAPSEMGQQLTKIMDRTGGDTSKMTPEEQKIYDKAVESGYYRPGGNSGRMSSTGQPNAPGYSNNTRGPGSAGYAGSSGGSMGSSGGPGSSYSGSSGGSGSYPR